MYVQPVSRETVTSFIDGIEIGSGHTEFTTSLKNHLINNYNIEYSSDGWPGQIRRLGDSIDLDWIEVFRKVTLEI